MCVCVWGGGLEEGDSNQKKKQLVFAYFFVLILYIKFQVPGSIGSLVLTQTKAVTDR